ncbi:CinA family protein [Corynebacterium rouxii]|uniref:CinA family protein n=1 Tax=Corynebacterium rouxii TaxID=2719119 RepID=A0A6I8MI59_9CORY|nr:nicotinamide-nucleotide amidohydrolase family protein [Corynebacterium rouxii]MDT9409053.1 nicotinamide-nucleotide amidohydrolase family protein [Corynebacterium rouxii]MDT9411234.1 nicotinamide-nucleotide amidohydrolase family protein [Corynebacterium rouxii]VZH85536.1 CinA family protein [Corynebacterium rouxii]
MLDDATQAAVIRMVDKLKQQNCTISTCESLTAGLMAATIANLPGSSQVLRGGLITYATDSKVSVAGVPAATVEEYGPVSWQCAEAMAIGAKRQFQSQWAVSLTGVAGPAMQCGQSVGTVWVGVALPNGTMKSKLVAEILSVSEQVVTGDRQAIRLAAVRAAAMWITDLLGLVGTTEN